MSLDPATRAAILRAAQANGINPAVAMAIAERESNFNPRAHNSRTIHGIYQMRGDLRQQYGIGDSEDPAVQAHGWGKFFNQTKGEMSQGLGRAPTDAEGYLGHHFGSGRAAKMLAMDPNTPVSAVFSPYERSINPHFDRAGTVGALNSSVMADINKRSARYGGGDDAPDFASFGDPVEKADFASFGEPVSASNGGEKMNTSAAAANAPDFSSFGTPV